MIPDQLYTKTSDNPTFFWAKSGNFKWFNLIVMVTGKAPFLQLTAWDLSKGAVVKLDASDITEWGKEIDDPNNYK